MIFFRLGEVTSVEQLPLPKKTVRSTAQEGYIFIYFFEKKILFMNFSLILVFLQLIGGLKSNRPEVNIADQIAIRSLVLSKSLGKIFCQIFFLN